MKKESYIRKIPSGEYRIYSEEGKTLGTEPTKQQAEDRLREIEYFKHKNSDVNVVEIDRKLDPVWDPGSAVFDTGNENPNDFGVAGPQDLEIRFPGGKNDEDILVSTKIYNFGKEGSTFACEVIPAIEDIIIKENGDANVVLFPEKLKQAIKTYEVGLDIDSTVVDIVLADSKEISNFFKHSYDWEKLYTTLLVRSNVGEEPEFTFYSIDAINYNDWVIDIDKVSVNEKTKTANTYYVYNLFPPKTEQFASNNIDIIRTLGWCADFETTVVNAKLVVDYVNDQLITVETKKALTAVSKIKQDIEYREILLLMMEQSLINRDEFDEFINQLEKGKFDKVEKLVEEHADVIDKQKAISTMAQNSGCNPPKYLKAKYIPYWKEFIDNHEWTKQAGFVIVSKVFSNYMKKFRNITDLQATSDDMSFVLTDRIFFKGNKVFAIKNGFCVRGVISSVNYIDKKPFYKVSSQQGNCYIGNEEILFNNACIVDDNLITDKMLSAHSTDVDLSKNIPELIQEKYASDWKGFVALNADSIFNPPLAIVNFVKHLNELGVEDVLK